MQGDISALNWAVYVCYIPSKKKFHNFLIPENGTGSQNRENTKSWLTKQMLLYQHYWEEKNNNNKWNNQQ